MKKIWNGVLALGTVVAIGIATLHVQSPNDPSVTESIGEAVAEPGSAVTVDARPSGSQPSHQAAQNSDRTTTTTAIDTKGSTVLRNGVVRADEIVTSDGTRYPLRTYAPLMVPNDPGAAQWWVGSTGLSSAWSLGYGSYTPTVAIIDTGFGLNHEEFAGRWAENAGEKGPTGMQAASIRNCGDRGLPLDASCNLIDDDYEGTVDNESGYVIRENPSRLNCTDRGLPLDKSCNMIDDDNNGYADDVRGWDFASYDNNTQAGETHPAGDGTNHGTMVAGVLGAIGNNAKGIAGVNWNAKILPLQAIDDDEYGNTLTLARAVVYAAHRDADIISLSLGTEGSDPYLRQAIQYAISEGSLVVAASGNDGCDCISYPARYPEVLAVGSLASGDSASVFSSYGASLDIMAPGEDMITPYWHATNGVNSYVSGAAGTSFSTPFVAGILAQLKSHRPDATAGELIAMLGETATHTGLSIANPRSSTRGFGSAHAGRAAARSVTPATPLLRYQFSPMDLSDGLSVRATFDCQATTYPSTVLYELRRNTELIYTTSELSKYTAEQTGWTARSLGYQCVGQGHDTPQTLRLIDLGYEVGNL